MVFGIKWLNSLNVNLGSINNSGNYNITKSDPEKVNGDYEFQAFGANATPYNLPDNWDTNVWQEVMRISNNSGDAELVGKFEIAETTFDNSTEPNIGVNLDDYEPDITGCAAPGALPAELGKFNVYRYDGATIVYWETHSEINVSHFEVERSPNAFDWKTLDLVKAVGNSTEKQIYYYNDFSDDAIVISNVLYYRLKMVDFDGSYEYSDIQALYKEKELEHALTIAPNPSPKRMSVTIDGNTQVKSLNIYDLTGKLIHYIKVAEGTKQYDLDFAQLGIGAGVYYISSQTEQNILKTLKFVVL